MLSIDSIIIILFLIITFVISLYYGRGLTTFQDYAVGNKKLPTMVITFSLIATRYDGRALNLELHNAYYRPSHTIIWTILLSYIMTYVFSRLMIPRMKEFFDHLTLAESMGSIYGRSIRVITALWGILRAILFLAIQMDIFLIITSNLLPKTIEGFNYIHILCPLLLIGYATFGGIRAVAYTDVYQFLFFGLCMPILVFFLSYKSGGFVVMWEKIKDLPQYSIDQLYVWHSNSSIRNHLLPSSILALLVFFDTAYIQRFYMSSSVKQAKNILNNCIIIDVIIKITFLSIGIALYGGNHIVPPKEMILKYLLESDYFPGMHAILLTSVIAIIMSTADSELHIASTLFAYDIWPTLSSLVNSFKASIFTVVRIASMVVGVISFILASSSISFMQLARYVHYMHIGVSIPVALTCLGFRPRSLTLLGSMVINAVLSAYYIFCKDGICFCHPILILTGSSLCTLVILHYLLPKHPGRGWVGIKDRSAWDLANQATQRWWLLRWQQLKAPFKSAYQRKIFPLKGPTFSLLGIYTIAHTTFSLFVMEKSYFYPYIYGFMTILFVATIMTIYPAFHGYKRVGFPLLYWLWPFLLCLLLLIAPFQFAKLSHYSLITMSFCISSLGIATLLLPLEAILLLLALSFAVHRFMPPHIPFGGWQQYQEATTLEWIFITALITVTLLGGGIYKCLRDKTHRKLEILTLTHSYENRVFMETIYNQLHWHKLDATYGGNLLAELSQMLKAPCSYLYRVGQAQLGQEINRFVKKLHQFGDLLPYRAKEERSLKLDRSSVKEVAISSIILKAYHSIRGLHTPLQLLLRNSTHVKSLLADPQLFEYFLMINLQHVSFRSKDHIVTLTIGNTLLQYSEGVVMLSGKATFSLLALVFCFSSDTADVNFALRYMVNSHKLPIGQPVTATTLYQVESRQIVEAHGGYIEIIEKDCALSCLYIFPVEGSSVMRFKTYDPFHLTEHSPLETEESLSQEKALLHLLTTRTSLSASAAEKALFFIKHAHGFVKRKSGLPYYTHPMAVAEILLEVTQDSETILAGLLHDIVEDTPITLRQISLMYGQSVAYMVDMVTAYHTAGYPWKLDRATDLLDACKDSRVVQIKLADRLHNLRTIAVRSLSSQRRIAKETLHFYIPWGKRNGAPAQWLSQMQQLCDQILNKR